MSGSDGRERHLLSGNPEACGPLDGQAALRLEACVKICHEKEEEKSWSGELDRKCPDKVAADWTEQGMEHASWREDREEGGD